MPLPYLPPPGPRNPSQRYTEGGAESTIPGYPTMQGGGTERMIQALQNAPRAAAPGPGARAADALEARPQLPPPPGHEGAVDPRQRQMEQLQLESAKLDVAKKRKEGEVWMQNGPYGMQKVSPGTPGAVLWQSAGY